MNDYKETASADDKRVNTNTVVDWTNLRTLIQEIDSLFEYKINSRRERITLNNLITEICVKATPTYQGLTDIKAFKKSLRNRIVAYSQYI